MIKKIFKGAQRLCYKDVPQSIIYRENMDTI